MINLKDIMNSIKKPLKKYNKEDLKRIKKLHLETIENDLVKLLIFKYEILLNSNLDYFIDNLNKKSLNSNEKIIIKIMKKINGKIKNGDYTYVILLRCVVFFETTEKLKSTLDINSITDKMLIRESIEMLNSFRNTYYVSFINYLNNHFDNLNDALRYLNSNKLDNESQPDSSYFHKNLNIAMINNEFVRA